MNLRKNLLQKTALGVGNARALVYTLESLPLPIMNRLITGQKRELPTPEQQRAILNQTQRLLAQDAQGVAEGLYPLEVFKPESSPVAHLSRWARVLGDSMQICWRRRNNKTAEFSRQVTDLADYPKYYQRNFHHQTDGYLSDHSAWLYEHQVELLFRGLADPMRRRLLRPMKKALGSKKRPRILEIACGPGTFTRQLAKSFPNAHITATDLSPHYIQYAKKRFVNERGVDFLVANAESLPFKSGSFDAVVAVFLHHELPQKVREKVLKESLRVCRKGGFWGLLDSLQLGDNPDLDWALEAFPETFHEPFYKNYINTPMLETLRSEFPKIPFKQKNHLLSKSIFAEKLEKSS